MIASSGRVADPTLTRAVFQDVRVFAVGRWQSDGKPPPGGSSSPSVTLLLDHQKALVMENLVQTGAGVSLILRRLDQSGEIPTKPVAADSLTRVTSDADGGLGAR